MSLSSKLDLENGSDGLSMTFADLFMNLAVCLILPSLLATTALDALSVPNTARKAAVGAEDTAPPPAVIVTFVLSEDGVLMPDPGSAGRLTELAGLSADDHAIAVFPKTAPYGAVATKIRELTAGTAANLKQVETLE